VNGFLRFKKEAKRWLGVSIDALLTFKEYHNPCMTKARAAAARLWSLTQTYGVVPAGVRAVRITCVQAVALYGSELWLDLKEGSRRDVMKLILNRHGRSTLGALPTTPRGALMRNSGHIPVALAVEARQQRFMVRLANAWEGSKSEALLEFPTPGAPTRGVAATKHVCGKRAEMMRWPDPGEK
jgi:hypothetical protein